MKNTDLIKEYLIPILPLGDNDFPDIWKVSFIKSVNKLLKLTNQKEMNRSDLKELDFKEGLEKYSQVINIWTPKMGLDVFWIEGLSIYTVDQYAIFKVFYDNYPDEIFNMLTEEGKAKENLISIFSDENKINAMNMKKKLLLNILTRQELKEIHVNPLVLSVEKDMINKTNIYSHEIVKATLYYKLHYSLEEKLKNKPHKI